MQQKKDSTNDDFLTVLFKFIFSNKLILFFLIFLFFLYFQPYRVTVVDSAEIGIKFYKYSSDESKKGGVEGTCRGWVLYNKYTTDIFRYPLFIQRKNYNPFIVTARDASIFTMDPQIAYRIDPDKVCHIFVKYRKDIKDLEEGYIRTCIYEAYRTCANKYDSDYLMSHRAEFENDVLNRLEKSLMREGFIVEEFTSAMTPPESLARNINEKNAAVQAALKAENQVKEAEANAKIKIAEAKGEAEAKRIYAEAEANANEIVARSLTPNLIKKLWIEKWNGVMPRTTTGENLSIMLNDK